jgi:hypothetical protein
MQLLIHDKGENTYLEEWHLETLLIFISIPSDEGCQSGIPRSSYGAYLCNDKKKTTPIRLLLSFRRLMPCSCVTVIFCSKVTHREIAGMRHEVQLSKRV